MAKKSKYAEKYKDPRWQKKRLEVLERDEWACRCCGDNESTLHVHHRYYERGKDIWDYPLKAFITLCEDCHRDETENRKESEEALLCAFREKFMAAEVTDFAIAIHNMPILRFPEEVIVSVYHWALVTPEVQDYLIERYFTQLREKREARKPKCNTSE